eukprot:358844_1
MPINRCSVASPQLNGSHQGDKESICAIITQRMQAIIEYEWRRSSIINGMSFCLPSSPVCTDTHHDDDSNSCITQGILNINEIEAQLTQRRPITNTINKSET